MATLHSNTKVFFLLFCCFSHNTQVLTAVVWCFRLQVESHVHISHAFLILHSFTYYTVIYSSICLLSPIANSLKKFCCNRERSWVVTFDVCHAIWPFSICVSKEIRRTTWAETEQTVLMDCLLPKLIHLLKALVRQFLCWHEKSNMKAEEEWVWGG